MKIPGLNKTNHGFWFYRPTSKGLPKGAPKPKPIFLGTKDEDTAVTMVMRLREQGVATAGDDRRLAAWVEIYCATKKASRAHRARTSYDVENNLAAMVAWMGNVTPASVTRQTVLAWHSALSVGQRSNSTVHRYIRYARAFFSWLVEQDVIRVNPASKLKIPPPSQTRIDSFCTREQRDALIASAQTPEIKFVFLAGFFLGLRINEIVNCQWNWFSADLTTCTVRNIAKSAGESFRTKTGRERVIPIHPESPLYEELASRTRTDGFLIHPQKSQGKAWLRWDPRKQFRAAVKEHGIEWVTPHTMRHTFGSLLAIDGVAEVKIRRWMGITPKTWESHYAGLSPTDSDIGKL